MRHSSFLGMSGRPSEETAAQNSPWKDNMKGNWIASLPSAPFSHWSMFPPRRANSDGAWREGWKVTLSWAFSSDYSRLREPSKVMETMAGREASHTFVEKQAVESEKAHAICVQRHSPRLFLNWSIIHLQCCVSFKYTAKWFSYTYICSFSDSFSL